MIANFVKKFVRAVPKDINEFQQAKREIAKEEALPMPSTSALLAAYRELVLLKKIKRNRTLEKFLIRREVRTISGIAPITVLTKPYPCPGHCVYCPNEKGMPKSYLSNEPAAARAKRLNFDPYTQVLTRLQTLYDNGHPVDKLELIVKGGTWGSYPWPYELWFIRRCYEGANAFQNRAKKHDRYNTCPADARPACRTGRPACRTGRALAGRHVRRLVAGARIMTGIIPVIPVSQDPSLTRDGYLPENLKREEEKLLQAQKKNERAVCRIIGLTLETRPDWIDAGKIRRMRLLGATRIELGVQHTDDKIQRLTHRGHALKETKAAVKLLRDVGFKVDFHVMPQLPGATPKKDLFMFKKLFADSDLRPDMIKIYPCTVIPNTELFSWWKEKKFTPYSDGDLVEMLIKVKSRVIPLYCRISRMIRDIPSPSIAAGNSVTNLRQVVQEKMRERGLRCKCLRCREVGRAVDRYKTCYDSRSRHKAADITGIIPVSQSPQLFKFSYPASGGQEYFLSFEDKKRKAVFAFLRLRLPGMEHKAARYDTWHAAALWRGQRIMPGIIPGSPFPELEGAALIRELHTYGTMVEIGKEANFKEAKVQHGGLGRKLMQAAEGLAKKAGYSKMAVIAGVGVREYYKKLGYKKEGTYMVKRLGI